MTCTHSDWSSLTPLDGITLGLEYANCHCGSTISRPVPVLRFWVCIADSFIRWELPDGSQRFAHIIDGWPSGPDAEACPEWLVDEALAAMSDSGTRHAAFAGFDRDWDAADDAMCAAWERKERAA